MQEWQLAIPDPKSPLFISFWLVHTKEETSIRPSQEVEIKTKQDIDHQKLVD